MTPVVWLEFRVPSLLKYRAKLLMYLEDMDLRKSPLTFQVSRHSHSFMCLWCVVQWSLQESINATLLLSYELKEIAQLYTVTYHGKEVDYRNMDLKEHEEET